MAGAEHEVLRVGDREVAISNPRKVLFPEAGHTKLDLARYYVAVAEGALRGAGGRPNVLVRYPNGIGGEFFYQKRAPQSRPPWIEVVDAAVSRPAAPPRRSCRATRRRSPGWRTSPASSCTRIRCAPTTSIIPTSCASISIPVPGVEWPQMREVAAVVRATLDDFGLVGWPKTSGSRGMHVYVRIERRWTFDEVRRAALALAREVERRAPTLATSKWWKEERHGVFLDYNQNAKDRTVAARVLGAADARRARLGAARLGRDRRLRSRRLHAGDDAGALRRGRRSPRGRSTSTPARSRRCSSSPRGRSATGSATRRGRRTTASRRASRRASQPSTDGAHAEASARSRSARAQRRTTRSPDSSAGRRGTPRRPRTWSRPTCSSMRMRGRFRTWTRIRVNLQHVPRAAAAQEPLDPDDDGGRLERRRRTPTDWRRTPSRARTAS